MMVLRDDDRKVLLLLTPARNEEQMVGQVIESVIGQERRPDRYVLISDGSWDKTDEIMKSYAMRFDFIDYLRREKPQAELARLEKVSPGQIGAIQCGLQSVAGQIFDYVGVLDADVLLPSNYYRRIVEEFERDSKLGIAGGYLESILPDGRDASGGFKNPDSVGGPVQMFRFECYQEIGGLKTYGHADCVAVIQARESGWRVRSFPDLVARHFVPFEGYAPTIAGKVPSLYHLGKMDYVMYVPVWFVLLQSAARCFSRPYLFAGAARLFGFIVAIVDRLPRHEPTLKGFRKRQAMYWSTLVGKIRRIVQAD
jgi:glycosyltransferase involved in cell wall biosynthesis